MFYNDAVEEESWGGGDCVLHIVLVEPEIPPNCGNIARTCAATGSRLHLVEPLGFDVSDRAVKRAGLDYWHLVEVTVHPSLDALFQRYPEAAEDLWLATTKAPRDYSAAAFSPNGGAAPGVPGEVPGAVYPAADGGGGAQPEPG